MTTVTLEHVTKRLEQIVGGHPVRQVVVDNVSLRIVSGSILAVLGPSGCGKSTLLRLIAGLITPDSGRVLYDQTNLNEIPFENRGIGMCFQDNALVPHWEARQSIGFFLRLRKREYEVPERMRRISQITGIGLEKLMDRLPRQLSGGEQQRVSIARALARDPRVFLFDEPFSNLDAPLRAQARIELKKLLHEFPVTSVYVTHDQHEAIALADRIAIMRAGKIEQVGTYQQLHDNPHNLFVATFLGSPPINLFAGLVRDHHWVGRSFGGYPIRADLADDVQVLMGVRPADMHIAGDGVPGRVETVIPFYSERYQLLEIEAAGERWQVIAPLDQLVAVGDTIHFGLNVDSVMYFDAQTHERIG